jgi:8-oxo-dGTP diphosphatase
MLEVAAGVLVRGDAVLVCQRNAAGSHPLKWEFPGGKRHPDESLPQCLKRELHEELAIDAVVGDELWRTRHYYQPDRAVDLFFFLAMFTGEPTNRVFAAVRWVTGGSLHSLDFLDADRALVSLLQGGHRPPNRQPEFTIGPR